MNAVAPLTGVRVISLGHTLPGLYCVAMLRDLGAGVLLIEPPPRTATATRYAAVGTGFPIDSLVTGTCRCAIDLKRPEGVALFRRLARTADVLVEGFRPGVAKRLGIDHGVLTAENPALVHAAISGFGQEGPDHERVGHDLAYLAVTGALALCGTPTGPPGIPGVTYADGLAGCGAALNIVAALHARTRTATGQFIDVAITDGPAFLMGSEYEHFWRTGVERKPGDTHLTGRFPWYRVFETRDHRYVAVGAVESEFYRTLCSLIGRPDLAARQTDDGADAHRAFEDAFRQRTRDEWIALFAEADAAAAPVLTPGEAAEAPAARRARLGSVTEAPTPLVRSPVRVAGTPAVHSRTVEETFAEYGVGADDLDALEAGGVLQR